MDKKAVIQTASRLFYTQNTMEDVRQQIMDQSQMDGTGFIVISSYGHIHDINIQHIEFISYTDRK